MGLLDVNDDQDENRLTKTKTLVSDLQGGAMIRSNFRDIRGQIASPVRILVSLLTILVAASASAQESTNFKLERLTLAATAGPATSANYATTITFAQEGPSGSLSRCNDGFLQSTGFWSVLGESAVPVRLMLGRNAADRTHPDLMWSGSSSEFTLYRATVPVSVIDPLNEFLVTSSCATTDTPPPAATTFYLVSPTGN